MIPQKKVVLDYLEPFELKDPHILKFNNELQTLTYLSKGLFFLYKEQKSIDTETWNRIEKLYPGVKEGVMMYGNLPPEFNDIPLHLINCFFHWYAVSLCNFVQLLGWVAKQANLTTKEPREYAKTVIPDVVIWRNKIGAHFARADEDKRDNLATRQFSVMPPVGFLGKSFKASPVTLSYGEDTSAEIEPWGITETHMRLIPRYWPKSQ